MAITPIPYDAIIAWSQLAYDDVAVADQSLTWVILQVVLLIYYD
jgi:hypothetical protein